MAGPLAPRARNALTIKRASQPPIEEPTTICGPRQQASNTRETVIEPAANRAVGELAFRFAVAGIIEAHTAAAVTLCPLRQRIGFGALHVGLVAGQKKQPRRTAVLLAHRDGVALGPLANLQKFQALIVHGRLTMAGAKGSIDRLVSPQTVPACKVQGRGVAGLGLVLARSLAGLWPGFSRSPHTKGDD